MVARWLAVVLVACGPIYAPPPPPPQQPPSQEPPVADPPAENPPEPRPYTPTARKPKPPGGPSLVRGPRPKTNPTSQVDIALLRDWEGQQLYAKRNYAEASAKFREAVARVPESRYFINLCVSLYAEGKYSEAMTACGAVERADGTPDLIELANDLMDWIKDDAAAQGITTAP